MLFGEGVLSRIVPDERKRQAGVHLRIVPGPLVQYSRSAVYVYGGDEHPQRIAIRYAVNEGEYLSLIKKVEKVVVRWSVTSSAQ